MFFLIKGQAEFVLPQFADQPYLNVAHNNHFGLVDIIGSSLKHNFSMIDWYTNKNQLKRQFSIKNKTESEVLYLDFGSLHDMHYKFPDEFKSIFDHIGVRYYKALN